MINSANHPSHKKSRNFSWKAVFFTSLAIGLSFIGLGFQTFPAVAGNTQNQILQTSSTGNVVDIIAPAGSGLGQVNFSPANFVLVIGANNTFILRNEDTADHTMTSRPGAPAAFDTGDISGLFTSVPITLTVPGTYAYYCQFHPSSMHGTITVIEPSSQ